MPKITLQIDDSELKTPHLLIYDLDSDAILFRRGMRERISLASTTKIFLALYARTHLSMDAYVKSLDISTVIGANSSLAYLEDWHRYRIDDLFNAMLIPSGNDAANILAEAAVQAELGKTFKSAAEANEAYVQQINKWLEEEGYNNTEIVDPAGYEYANRSNLTDLIKASRKFTEDSTLMEIVAHAQLQYRNEDGIYFNWKNTNELMDQDSNYYSPLIHGIKTGSVPDEFYNLISYFEYKKHRILIFFFTAATKEDYLEDYKKIEAHLIPAIDAEVN